MILNLAVLLSACTVRDQYVPQGNGPVVSPTEQYCYDLEVEFSDEMCEIIESNGTKALGSGLEGSGIVSLERIFPDAGEWEPRHREAGLHRWYRVTYDSSTSVTRAAEIMFPYAEKVEEVPPAVPCGGTIPFNDPLADGQWGLCNNSGVDVNVIPMWKYCTGRPEVIVNVLDHGVSLYHEDLRGVVIPPGPDGSKRFCYGYTGYAIEAGRHGTHVAGIIAAINNNGTGVCSVAGGSDGTGGVRILNSQIFMPDPNDNSKTIGGNIPDAIVWGADHGAVISQNSWSYSYKTEEEAKASTIPSTTKAAIDYFIKNAGCDASGNQVGPMKGGVVFTSAGNSGWSYGQPGAYAPVISVGAVGPDGKKASFSNYGDWVDLCAPGGNHTSAGMILSTVATGTSASGYASMQGTSQACPYASGVAALLVSHFGGPGFTADDLTEMLLRGANRSYGVSEKIGPLVDAKGSYDYTNRQPPPTITTEYAGDYVFKCNESLRIVYSIGNRNSTTTVEASSSNPSAVKVRVNNKSAVTVVINQSMSEKNAGRHSFTIRATNNTWSVNEQTFEVEILPDQPPVFSGPKSLFMGAEGTVMEMDLSTMFSDPEGQDITYAVAPSESDVFDASLSGNILTLSANAMGTRTIRITAEDAGGHKTIAKFPIGVFNDKDGPLVTVDDEKKILTVTMGREQDAEIRILDQASRVLRTRYARIGIFNPALLDISDIPSGRHTVEIRYGGIVFRLSVDLA